ncbi:hypothetical protein [Geobacter sp. SVR]|uniref:hypothetical protein n=1 Tax=Geobacter sp. SVR TaxID=2495594 RepID=UPI00143EF869|nr:hypothetical protein [Geobacter sp. SVR]BCS52336.1 hypothetical protein GSVR_06440 [Geobacter sp. SVR]GCF85005.1 hypothetical protein GSbR_16050 [Geobacter sp. SVR]
MTDLLLITDVPRLRKIFSLFSDERDVRLRVATSLESGAEELLAAKPAVVFVQAYLSGLSAEILLMHLKKQLGRRRTRFVLLSSEDQTGEDVRRLYHGFVDISRDDNLLFQEVQALVADLGAKGRKGGSAPQKGDNAEVPSGREVMPAEEAASSVAVEQPSEAVSPVAPPDGTPAEASLEEQGIVYSRRPPLSVYSEFTSSFDSAVSSMNPPEPAVEPPRSSPPLLTWSHEEADIEIAERPRSRVKTFLLWFVPIVAAVIVVTVLQHPESRNGVAVTATAPAVSPPPIPSTPPKAGEPDARLSDRAVMSAIAENAGQAPSASPKPPRLSELPAFIPRAGLDKAYGSANPGWERYKGQVTEFKVYREGNSVKAIQIIDRGGQGLPESYMKTVFSQLTKAPSFVVESSEKKDGYEIQRGRLAENLKAVFYRDTQGGLLRAFVVTWQ